MSQNVLWKATPRQSLYLAASDFYVLYGGAAGGGKTDAGIMDGMGLNNPGREEDWHDSWLEEYAGVERHPAFDPKKPRAIDYQDYKGLFLRRSMPELLDVIQRTHKLYPLIGWAKDASGKIHRPVWREQKKLWQFPSGAQILFGYVQNAGDERRYQGWEYQWIMWEEITQWPTSGPFEFLNTRVRRKATLPVRPGVRATCNPGGIGHQWVRDFWNIPDDPWEDPYCGEVVTAVPTRIDVGEGPKTLELSRRFIASRLEDNPHVDQEQYALVLAGQSKMLRDALRHGLWNITDIKGQIYKHEMALLHQNGHIREVPWDPRFPANVIFDLGINDSTCMWFHQRIEGVDYFIDYVEISQVGAREHMRILEGKPYKYGAMFMPHDIVNRQNRHDGTITTLYEIYSDLGMKHIVIVPRTQDLRQGIERCRQLLPKSFFDQKKCAEGIKSLSNYRYAYDDRLGTLGQKPLHDRYSHGADAWRGFAQAYDLIDDAVASSQTAKREDGRKYAYLREEAPRRRRRWKV